MSGRTNDQEFTADELHRVLTGLRGRGWLSGELAVAFGLTPDDVAQIEAGDAARWLAKVRETLRRPAPCLAIVTNRCDGLARRNMPPHPNPFQVTSSGYGSALRMPWRSTSSAHDHFGRPGQRTQHRSTRCDPSVAQKPDAAPR
jgi:hypothetical protein